MKIKVSILYFNRKNGTIPLASFRRKPEFRADSLVSSSLSFRPQGEILLSFAAKKADLKKDFSLPLEMTHGGTAT